MRFLIVGVFATSDRRLFSVASENSVNFHFIQVIFAKNGLAEIRTATVTHRIILIVAKVDKTMKSKIPIVSSIHRH